jgi:uncharacterized membrane-anchored protein
LRQVLAAGKECVRQKVSRVEARSALAKVPRITIYFWIIKILTTALGESTSDYLVHRFNPYLAVVGGFLAFVIAIAVQFRVRVYVPSAYWLAVTMVAVFGTMAADVLHVEFRVPYIASTLFFAVVLTVVFAGWYRSEGTLSIHSITTPRREAFYWAAVLATFAMGTAVGDLVAYRAGLGFLSAGLVFAVLFAIPGLGFRYFNLNAVFAFWFAYVMTRPLGASFADWMGKSHAGRGLNYGDGPVSLVLAILIVALVSYLSITGADKEPASNQDDRQHADVAYADGTAEDA